MTAGISNRRRRSAVSLSMPVTSSDPIGQLDRVVEILHQANRALPGTALGRKELTALGGILTQISSALLALTDQLSAPTQRYDRVHWHGASSDSGGVPRPPAVASSLQSCRDGIRATYLAARAFDANLRQCLRATRP
jgi:hypothetical protein